jgi:type II secretory pathway pseudopilin PulG
VRRWDDRGSESGFTIVELVVALGLLAIVAAPLAGVFWSAIRTASVSNHRTDGSAIASREIEGMRAVPYGQVGFYNDQPGAVVSPSTFDGLTPVSLGTTSPASGNSVPQMQPKTPDPSAGAGYAPDSNPANASPVVQGAIKYSILRYVMWANASDPSSTFTKAYKRLTVIVSWSDAAGAHTVRQDSILYPGGQGQYLGPMGGTTTTTTTAAVTQPNAPVLAPIVPLASPADQTQVALSWSQPGGGAQVTTYSIKYSTNVNFPAGQFTVIANLAPSILNYTVTGLAPSTTYYFQIVAYAGAMSATSNPPPPSATTATASASCTLGGLNVSGATTLSTTGTILQNNGKMSEDLNLSWTTSGSCPHTYNVKAVDPSSAADPSSPYALAVSAGSYSATVFSSGSKSWAVGLHTFTVWDVNTNSATTVVKTFKVCVDGVASC